jgi:hypothetical protein
LDSINDLGADNQYEICVDLDSNKIFEMVIDFNGILTEDIDKGIYVAYDPQYP